MLIYHGENDFIVDWIGACYYLQRLTHRPALSIILTLPCAYVPCATICMHHPASLPQLHCAYVLDELRLLQVLVACSGGQEWTNKLVWNGAQGFARAENTTYTVQHARASR